MHCEILTNVTIRGDEGKFLLSGFADFLGRLRLTHKGDCRRSFPGVERYLEVVKDMQDTMLEFRSGSYSFFLLLHLRPDSL